MTRQDGCYQNLTLSLHPPLNPAACITTNTNCRGSFFNYLHIRNTDPQKFRSRYLLNRQRNKVLLRSGIIDRIGKIPAKRKDIPLKILLIVPGRKGFSTEGLQSLGIGMIAAVLKRAGHNVTVLDMSVLGSDSLESALKTTNPELVGITVVTLLSDLVFKTIIPAIRLQSSAKIVVGGPHPTACPDEALTAADFAVRGEGEETIVELCASNLNPDGIAGLSYREADRAVHNPPRPFIDDLDSLPFPARELFPPLSRYGGLPSLGNKTVGNISTSRGCYGLCKFCFNAIFGRKCRFRSAANVVEEWELLVRKFGVDVVTISDDHFTSSQKRTLEICRMLHERKLDKTPWTCSNGIRVETASMELLTAMKKAGCTAVAFGIESGSDEALERMGKKISLEKVRTAVSNARKAGINTLSGFFMIGTPWDTEQTMKETIEFAKSLPLDFAQFAIATPYPGTEMYEMVKDRMLGIPYSEYGTHEGMVYFEMDQLPGEIVSRYFSEAYRSFYFRPTLALRHLKRITTNPSVLPVYIKGLKNFVLR